MDTMMTKNETIEANDAGVDPSHDEWTLTLEGCLALYGLIGALPCFGFMAYGAWLHFVGL